MSTAPSLVNLDPPARHLQSASLSVVIPFFNEEGNVLPLLEEVQIALKESNRQWEVIAVNDGSSDDTKPELDQARDILGHHVHVIHLARNFGQTAAMQTGIEAAKGDLIVTMDGDRQNDPADIEQLIQHLEENDLDMVAGWRRNRQDAELNRKLPSRIANFLIRRVTGIDIKDNGCSLKVFRGDIIKQVVLQGEMHRFIPAWVALITDPARIGQLPVNHRARTVGQSKYGLSRTARVILDLLVVAFFMKFSKRPGHFFGFIGLTFGGFGSLVLTYLFCIKLFLGEDIGSRPLLFTGILFVIAGLQLITTGVLAEILTRSNPSTSYPVRQQTREENRRWHDPVNV